MRGTCEPGLVHELHGRFIPARAGNIRTESTCIALGSVHPRTCGEHAPAAGDIVRNTGSSPHVRGTCQAVFCKGRADRFIPARAGNILLNVLYAVTRSVHPRTCGEHHRKFDHTGHPSGSSPHVRGTFEADPLGALEFRFIPARAGNIHSYDSFRYVFSVHPRTCGEHGLQYYRQLMISVHPRTCGEHLGRRGKRVLDLGSSPHVRGT